MTVFTAAEAIALASEAHAGQVDKDGKPYIDHPRRVMESLTDELARIVAALHDVVEDCADRGYDLAFLAARGVPADALGAVEAMTKRPGEQLEVYWARVAANPLARAVKLADIADNSDETRLAALPVAQQDWFRTKYARARAALGTDAR